MWILLGHVRYEGCEVLGVYSSEESAYAAWGGYTQRKNKFEYHTITFFRLDAPINN